ncbi:pirin family protein [Legionella fairfieldensis]|uniref:pirin family protein n=1 Tax=Legionella fairfieldensis TaxID=45064 RepID=UPI00048DA220|nr:pirin family protein [Legionella fairfieldensis]
MLMKRYQNERGYTHLNWLKSMHSFSFGDYYNPNHRGFASLRVINEDRVIPGAGFATHAHKNMEIISYVLKGALAHKDSMGNGSVIKSGDVQIMSAGTGVTHSEYNASDDEEVHFLQIWITPNVQNELPTYQQKSFLFEEVHDRFHVVVSPDGEDNSLLIKQNARMLVGKFSKNNKTIVQTQLNHQYWLQMAQGIAEINGITLSAGDGLALQNEEMINIFSLTENNVLLFDLF